MTKPATPSVLQERVNARVKALGKPAIKLATDGGLGRGFIRDIIDGRKKTFKAESLAQVARALDCDPEFLLGQQDEVRREVPRDGAASGGITYGGICETGVRRTPAAMRAARTTTAVPLEPDPRHPGLANVAFLVRGDGMAGEHITDGMIVGCIDAGDWRQRHGEVRDGLIVVVRATRQPDGDVELSLRRVAALRDGLHFQASPAEEFGTVTPGPGVEVVAVVTRAVRLFPVGAVQGGL
jgi:hypothetical protein